MGITLGLLTALAWGSSDFVARFASRRMGSLRTTLYMQLFGFVLLTVCLPWIGGWGHLMDGSGWRPWAWGALAGIFNGAGTLFLYRAFEFGKLSVVAPLSASYPALTVVLSMFSGERLTGMRVVGIVCTLLGVVLVASGENVAAGPQPGQSESTSVSRTGISSAFFASLSFGVLFWFLGKHAVPAVGYGATVWMIRLTSSLLTTAVVVLLRQPVALPREGHPGSLMLSLVAMSALDTGAFVLNNIGMQMEQVSVIGVLSSLYCAVTVVLAAIFLRERLSQGQWLGVTAILAGIALISR